MKRCPGFSPCDACTSMALFLTSFYYIQVANVPGVRVQSMDLVFHDISEAGTSLSCSSCDATVPIHEIFTIPAADVVFLHVSHERSWIRPLQPQFSGSSGLGHETIRKVHLVCSSRTKQSRQGTCISTLRRHRRSRVVVLRHVKLIVRTPRLQHLKARTVPLKGRSNPVRFPDVPFKVSGSPGNRIRRAFPPGISRTDVGATVRTRSLTSCPRSERIDATVDRIDIQARGFGSVRGPPPFDRSEKTRPSTTRIFVDRNRRRRRSAHRDLLAARDARPMDVHVLKKRDARAAFYLVPSARRDPGRQVPAKPTHEGFAVKFRRSA
mmetsp:Transcript_8496/g.53075  ORF Transcript_8496/g.53075 Transcript_8496/m.53075 type:complete len:323 (-) Transcript_8496:295-1263(-)